MPNLIAARKHFIPPAKAGVHWKSPYINRINESILDFIGNTPLIKLNKIPKDYGLSCEIYAKCEFMNPAGSSKDRISFGMMKDAESGNYIKEMTEFVEPTSGNTGIGVAFLAAMKDKKCIIVTGEKNSSEKVSTMKLLGAEVIQTNKSATAIARQIKESNPDNVVMLDQFENHVNPQTHYYTTGVEILGALGEVDMLVLGAGTGGTVSGAGHRIKEMCPNCTIIIAEPDGSTMFNVNGKIHPFIIEGIGGSTVPIVLDKSIADGFEIVTDEEAFLMAREVCRKEGLLCGGSSGAAMAAAIKAIKRRKLGAGQKVVVVFPDGIRNYMTKFVCEQWMEAHLFMDPPEHTMKWWRLPVTDLKLSHTYPIIDTTYTCAQAITEMKHENIAIVVDDKGTFVGAVSKDSFRHAATNPTKLPNSNSEDFNFDDPVIEHLVKDCYTLALNGKKGMPNIGLLSRILDITQFVVIGKNTNGAGEGHFAAESVATADDVLDFIFTHR
ncbi:unnamed protein product, partial [Brenthis ino]